MKLEVGMYVRTTYGITQYKEYNTTNGKLLCMPVKDGTRGIFANIEDIIGEPSFNIIDLIEEGDYVNGVRVTDIKDGKPYREDYNDPYYSYYIDEDEIYSIVTREQFESMEYKIN